MKDRRVLLTGATGGIGAALARDLVAAGAFVVLQGRNQSALELLADSLGHANTAIVCGDLTCARQVETVAEEARSQRVNVLVNNAGVNEFTMFETSNLTNTFAVNVTGPMQLTQMLLPYFKSLGNALIVNIGSAFGAIGFPGYVTYCATKHAVKGFSEALGRELSDTKVKVLYVSPRATDTKMNSLAARHANIALGVKSDTAGRVANRILRAMDNG
ncbi:MAG: SDR family oxidoreductase, partial [Pseudomonadales bacterium]